MQIELNTTTVEIETWDDGDGQLLTNSAGVEKVLARWAGDDPERAWMQTGSHDFAMAYMTPTGVSLTSWDEAGNGSYYVVDAPVVRA